MLKGIPNIISSDIMQVLMKMGHGDELVIADANFPAASNAKRLIDAAGCMIPDLLDAILQFVPLDQYVEDSVFLMEVDLTKEPRPAIWDKYEEVIRSHEPDFKDFAYLPRFDYYDRASNAFAVIASGDASLNANIIIKKGVVK